MALQKGDVVLVPFPFTDLTQTKLRPAVVLWSAKTSSDVTLCFVSSQHTDTITSEEFLLDMAEPEFQNTGLRVTSKVRVTRIVTLERGLITRRLGCLSVNQIQQLNQVMQQAFQLQ